MTFRSLRLRLLLAGLASTIFALALAGYGLTVLFERHVERRVDAELGVYLDQLATHLDLTPEGKLTISREPGEPRFETPLSGLYWQVMHDAKGEVLRSRSLWDSELALPHEPVLDDDPHRYVIAGPDGAELYLVQRPVKLPDRLGGTNVRIAAAIARADITQAVREFSADLTPLLTVIGLFLLAAGFLQVLVGLRPLSAIRSRLAAVRSDASARIGTEFPDEVRPLAQEIDDLLDSRDAELKRAKSRAADLAHGLRTPLQVLRSELSTIAQAGHRETASNVMLVIKGMERNVERELTRARLAMSARNTSADVKKSIEQITRVIQRTPYGQMLTWTIDIPDGLTARIDPDDLSEAAGNLIENAARHADSEVAVRGRREGEHILLEINDDGPGLPETFIDKATERGARLDERGSGSGLGLAIVSDIVEFWSGSLSLSNSGKGLCAAVRLPSAEAANLTQR